MTVVIVNKYWLDHIWGYIAEGNETSDINMVDMSEESNVRLLVENYVKPYWNELPSEVEERLKATWKYALNSLSDQDLRKPLNNLLSPFQDPADIRKFYSDAWSFMFADEVWEISDLSLYKEVNESTSSPWDVMDLN